MVETIITSAFGLLVLLCWLFYYIIGIIICFGIPVIILFGVLLTTNYIYNYIVSKASRKI